MTEHIDRIAQSISKANLLNEVDAEEVLETMQQENIDPKDTDKLVSTMVYIKKRMIEKQSRYAAFKKAFPLRCIPEPDSKTPFPNTTGEVSRTAIEIKAKRIEQGVMFKKIVTTMQMSLHVGYALERYAVLDKVLGRILDKGISDRDLAPLSKMFMEETRKPQEIKGMEVNLNLNDSESMKTLDDKISQISAKLDGKSADEIIEVLALPKEPV